MFENIVVKAARVYKGICAPRKISYVVHMVFSIRN